MSVDFEVKEKAEFNMAVSSLNRINSLLIVADTRSIEIDVYGWFHALLALFRELSSWMTPAEIAQYKSFINRINPQIANHVARATRSGRREVDSTLYMQLQDFEIDLRTLAKKSGLLMKMQEDRSFGI